MGLTAGVRNGAIDHVNLRAEILPVLKLATVGCVSPRVAPLASHPGVDSDELQLALCLSIFAPASQQLAHQERINHSCTARAERLARTSQAVLPVEEHADPRPRRIRHPLSKLKAHQCAPEGRTVGNITSETTGSLLGWIGPVGSCDRNVTLSPPCQGARLPIADGDCSDTAGRWPSPLFRRR